MRIPYYICIFLTIYHTKPVGSTGVLHFYIKQSPLIYKILSRDLGFNWLQWLPNVMETCVNTDISSQPNTVRTIGPWEYRISVYERRLELKRFWAPAECDSCVETIREAAYIGILFKSLVTKYKWCRVNWDIKSLVTKYKWCRVNWDIKSLVTKYKWCRVNWDIKSLVTKYKWCRVNWDIKSLVTKYKWCHAVSIGTLNCEWRKNTLEQR